MRKTRLARATLAGAAIALAAGHAAMAEPSDAVRLARSIFAAKSDVLDRARAGEDRSDERMRAFETFVASAPSTTWAAVANRDAFLLYLLTGGSARVTAGAAEQARSDRRAGPLVAAFESIEAGRKDEAATALQRLSALEWPGVLGGLIALAQARTVDASRTETLLRFLNEAALLAPGTLVEETALRRALAVHAEAGETTRAARLYRRYAAQFGASAFAPEVAEAMRRLVVEAWSRADHDGRDALVELARRLDAPDADATLLEAGRAALAAGRLSRAKEALDALAPDRRSADASASRRALYAAIVAALSDGGPDAATPLALWRFKPLVDTDRALLEAAIHIGALGRDEAIRPEAEGEATYAPLARMRAALETADRLLAEGR